MVYPLNNTPRFLILISVAKLRRHTYSELTAEQI